MQRFPIMGRCCGSVPFPPVSKTLNGRDPLNPRESWRIPAPERMTDATAPDGYWDIFEASQVYRIEIRPAFVTSQARWFVERSRIALESRTHLGTLEWKITPPVLNFAIGTQNQLVNYPLTVASAALYPDTEFDTTAGYDLVAGFTVNRILDGGIDAYQGGRAIIGLSNGTFQHCFSSGELSRAVVASQEFFAGPSLVFWLYNSNPCFDDYLADLRVTREWLPNYIDWGSGLSATNDTALPPTSPVYRPAGVADNRGATLISVSTDLNFQPD